MGELKVIAYLLDLMTIRVCDLVAWRNLGHRICGE